ncbi:unnamed protein product [Mytilus coruscus]|uniref:Uncharacterized protein n=1 Tax=Mytilus coruscus TaxID=42192 RepID=A0A6J8CAJ3_MYTCO|nr:unnamed protein product [Mytilus coruscus]
MLDIKLCITKEWNQQELLDNILCINVLLLYRMYVPIKENYEEREAFPRSDQYQKAGNVGRHYLAGNALRSASGQRQRERSQTGGGPLPTQPSQAEVNIINCMKDTASFRGVPGGQETAIEGPEDSHTGEVLLPTSSTPSTCVQQAKYPNNVFASSSNVSPQLTDQTVTQEEVLLPTSSIQSTIKQQEKSPDNIFLSSSTKKGCRYC